jgi:hypothetical protein
MPKKKSCVYIIRYVYQILFSYTGNQHTLNQIYNFIPGENVNKKVCVCRKSLQSYIYIMNHRCARTPVDIDIVIQAI